MSNSDPPPPTECTRVDGGHLTKAPKGISGPRGITVPAAFRSAGRPQIAYDVNDQSRSYPLARSRAVEREMSSDPEARDNWSPTWPPEFTIREPVPNTSLPLGHLAAVATNGGEAGLVVWETIYPASALAPVGTATSAPAHSAYADSHQSPEKPAAGSSAVAT